MRESFDSPKDIRYVPEFGHVPCDSVIESILESVSDDEGLQAH
jgi:hypothetical protein